MKLRFSISQLYFYLVCFIMLVTIILGLTNLVRAGIDILFPASRPAYLTVNPPRENPFYPESILPKQIIEQEIEAQRDHQQTMERTIAFNSAVQKLLQGLTQVLIAFPVYLYHWRRIPLLS